MAEYSRSKIGGMALTRMGFYLSLIHISEPTRH